MALIDFTDKGLYCSQGGFYIDPWKPVERAVITHAHSDHARWGHQSYLSHPFTRFFMRIRLGENDYQTLEWGETLTINGVRLSFHPAGHMIGSSQVRLEYNGEVWVVSGDYKVENDGISGAFEPLRCHTFVTESTFGLPIYNWKPQPRLFQEMQDWVRSNQQKGKASVLLAYSLGKAQRILPALAQVSNRIFAHGAIAIVQQQLREAGWDFPVVERVTNDIPKSDYREQVIIAPPSADGSPWIKRFSPYAVGVCSGWMQVRGNVRRRNADAGFAISDHADWKGLLDTIKETGAERVFVTHGFQAALSRYLNEMGLWSAEVKTEYGVEEEETLSESEPTTN